MADLLATADDLVDFGGPDRPGLDLALAVASGVVQSACRQRLVYVDQDLVTLVGGGVRLILPERPVISVLEVVDTADGTWSWDGRDGLARLSGRWPATVAVLYSHGYADVPADLQGVTLTVALRLLDNPSGLRAESVAGYSATYGDAAGISLTASERAVCDRYRRRAASVQVTA